MSVVIKTMTRRFKFQDNTLPDPDPSMSVTEVIEHYSPKYPELAIAKPSGPVEVDGALEYNFEYSVGNKG